ncbi:hypothetical protein SDRG_10194 [Saprolegnia diclina VS20]|uniref:Uncharacterized protein n=1 Tax=Saprolegnia diclina (strain VS20) TaxID=1156394 RepID=T0Q2F3_SAPDV|nr:hypothetical protein SDRG_10194 [Saprolegnia diclina VS20]EQC31994.1 hypothetical protein SDRG_10194 [Saprolegnia diclina VS20]|eukprot:XP_008614396.1 hypothetical protein SDRG_10194 [Saprolegnia diclina VS20]
MRSTLVMWLAAVAAVVLSSTVAAQQQQQELPAGLEDYVKQQLAQAISQDVAQEVARAVAERVAQEQRNRLYSSPPPTSLTPTTTAPTSGSNQPVLSSPAPADAAHIQGELRAIAQQRAELQREQEALNKERTALNEVIAQLQNRSTAPATIAPVAVNASTPVTVSVASTADGIATTTDNDDGGAPWGIIGVCVGLVAAVALVVVGVKKRNEMNDGLETPAEYASGFHTAEAASARESKWGSYEVVTPLDLAGVPPEDPILDDATGVEAPKQLHVRGLEAVL